MGDVQDDEKWLYGEDQAEKETQEEQTTSSEKNPDPIEGSDKADSTEISQTNGEEPPTTETTNGTTSEKEGTEETLINPKKEAISDEESSDEEALSVTIGTLKKPAEIAAQTHQARFQPKATPTSGIKEDDFRSAGKVNGIPVAELTAQDHEDKAWRKPGADISDYFNYGFTEDTWFKYCDRQKGMRVHESGVGLSSVQQSVHKIQQPYGSMQNEVNGRRGHTFPRMDSSRNESNTIQVMTAERREYSNKVMNPPPGYPAAPYDMELGGGYMPGQPSENSYYPSYYDVPPPISAPPPPPPSAFDMPPDWSSQPPPPNIPPTTIPPPHLSGPPPINDTSIPPPPAINKPPPSTVRARSRDRDMDRRRRSPSPPPRKRDRSRSPRRSRSPSRRSRSRGRSPRRSRSRGKSRSPKRSRSPRKHKHKKSKRGE